MTFRKSNNCHQHHIDQICRGSSDTFTSLFQGLAPGNYGIQAGQKTQVQSMRYPPRMQVPFPDDNVSRSRFPDRRFGQKPPIGAENKTNKYMARNPQAMPGDYKSINFGKDRVDLPISQDISKSFKQHPIAKKTQIIPNLKREFHKVKNIVQKDGDEIMRQLGLRNEPAFSVNYSSGAMSFNEHHFDHYFQSQQQSDESQQKDSTSGDPEEYTQLSPHPLYEKDFENPQQAKAIVKEEQDQELKEEVEPDEYGQLKDIWEDPIDPKMYKSLVTMQKFTERYLQKTDTKLCSDLTVPSMVLKGLAHHKATLGAPLCPCRHYDDKEAEVKDGYWNCPCKPMRDHNECHCMLFLTDDNEFQGTETKISVETVLAAK